MIDCIADTDKSDIIWLGTRQQLAMISTADKDLHLPSGTLQASVTARNLRVIIDQQLTFDAHACACSRACYYHLRRIRQIRRFIAATGPCNAFITSHLDYCNGLFANCSVAIRQRLQRIQNSAAVWYVQNLLLATLHHCYTSYIGYQLPGV